MPRLLSDVKGRIRHVMVSSHGRFDEHRIRGILSTFPADVEVTILYSYIPPRNLPMDCQLVTHEFFIGKIWKELLQNPVPKGLLTLLNYSGFLIRGFKTCSMFMKAAS